MGETFVGRLAELEQIAAVLGSGEGAAGAIVVGDPGVGKSRLLAEAVRAAGLPTLRVVGYESERLVPLAAASDLLRALVSVPEHGGLLDEVAFRSSEAIAPVRVFEAAHRALSSAAPALLLVDDVQWADDLSLALVHYLLRAASAGGGSLRLLAAERSGARTIGFAEDVARLLPPPRSAVVDLRPFGRRKALELALSLDPALDREEAGLLCERSAGVPFWIEVLVRSGGAPLDARQLLTGRLRDAGRDAGELLALLAVVARPLSADDAAVLLEWPLERAEAAADDLVSRGLAARAGGAVRMAHDLLREAAAEELPERRRRGLHGRVADWLEETAKEELSLLGEALEHRLVAGERPVGLAVRLVSSPQRRRLGVEGLSALAAVADEADVATREGQSLRAGVAGLAFELGEHRLALDRWTDFAPVAADPPARFVALLGASKAAFELGWEHAREAHELLEGAVASATTDEALVAARVHEARIVLWLDHGTAEGAAIAREALARSRGLGTAPSQRRVRLEALQAAREAAMQENDGEEILRLSEEMLALTRGWDDDAHAEALLARAVGQARTAGLGEAEAGLRAGLELARRRALPLQEAEAALSLAGELHDRGRLDEAERVEAEAQELALRVQRVRPKRLIAHELRLVRGDPEQGLSEYVAAVDGLPDPHVRIWPRQIAASFLSRARVKAARDEVAAMLRQAAEDAAAARCPRCTVTLQVASAEALAHVGSQAEAEVELGQAEALPPRDALNRYLRFYARALVTAGRDPAALLEEVCAEAERLERRLELLWARIDLARVLADRRWAAELLREVAAAADAMGAVVPRLVAERELRRLGVRTWRRGRGAAGDLSERERQVAELVASGASNPEIAQALFLSRKTVERHVSNVLAKLGARNRAQLAALLAREGEGAPR